MPSIRAFRKLVVLGVVAVVTATAIPALSRAQASPDAVDRTPPNVLIIVTDDQRARGTLAVMPQVRRWFGHRGTRFDRAFVTTPTCCPSRASMFTGMYAHNHGVRTSEWGEAENLDQSRTVQHHLDEFGYETGLFGKYLNGWDVNVSPPDFDRWGMFSDSAHRFYRGGKWNVNGVVRRVSTYSTVFIQRLALRFLRAAEANDGKPWFLVLTALAPHAPAIPRRGDLSAPLPRFRITPDMTEEDRSDKPDFVRDEGPSRAHIRALRAAQLRTLLSVDRMVGAVRAALAQKRELANTIAFFTSDNGLMWGEHALSGKGVAYEPSIQIPFFATWPGRIPAGDRDRRLVANIDIAPTIYDVAGIAPSFPVDGRSILDDFSRNRILLEHWERADRDAPNWAALRWRNDKYIESYVADHAVASWLEYYRLSRDPWELNNLLYDEGQPAWPETEYISQTLRRDLVCAGTEGPTACP